MKRFLISALGVSVLAMTLGIFGIKSSGAEAAPPGAAWNLGVVNVGCNNASIGWQPSGIGVQQWADLSHWNGYYWQWDEFGPMGTFQSSQQLANLIPNTTYYVRINTGTWDGYWLASDWVSFTTNCQVQYQSHCSNLTYMLIIPGNPQQLNDQVCTNKSTGATYTHGETVTICYDVSSPRYVRVVSVRPGGAQTTLFDGNDDGSGDCKSGTAGGPNGRRDVYMYNQYGQLLSSTYYFVN